MNNLTVHKKRNSLIELYRFLFALNVMIGHGLFPIKTEHFGPDRISVEFFFVLSGFLLYNSLEKYKEMSLPKAIKTMVISKMKPLLIPTVIGLISNAIYNYLTNYNPLKVFRYLWYIPAMMAAFLLHTVLRVLIKNSKVFYITVAGIFMICACLRFFGNEDLFFFDYLRSPLAVGLGILLGKMPKPEIKRKWIWWLMLVPVLAAVFVIVFLRLAKDSRAYEALLDLVLFPLLIYISFRIDFNFPIFNYLGALSFGIYAYQCPGRMLWGFGITDAWLVFFVIVGLTLIDDFAKRLIKYFKRKAVQTV